MAARGKSHQGAADDAGQHRKQNERHHLSAQVVFAANNDWHNCPLKTNRERGRSLYSSRDCRARVNAEKRQRTVRMKFSMYFVYSALLILVLIFGLPYWLYQMLRHGKYRSGFLERFGIVPSHLVTPSPQPTIWVHAVSVGEVLAVSRLVEHMRARWPGYRVVISTTTDTGQKLARTRFGGESVFYFPIDLGFAIRSYMKSLRPRLVVIAETEFWPNFLRLSKRSGASVAIVNARISDRSIRGYKRVRWWLKSVIGNVDLFLAQTYQDRSRLTELGAPESRVEVTGNLKFELEPGSPPALVANLHESFETTNAGPILVCGSTVDDEEERMLLQAFQSILASHPRAVMILAPRHPERFAAVASLLESFGIKFLRRSLWSGEPVNGGVLLLDTIGELSAIYGLADIAFVGGSLVPKGGHNIIEPARHGVAIVVGNHTDNFRDIIWLFQTQDAV
jgi:3-deoxy-D-manno-octulosonic-acid transferase